MKNRKFACLQLLWLFLLAACQSDLELPPGADGTSDLSAFNVRAAEAYFEANAHDLALLRLRDSVPITTRAGVSAELIPEWDKAIHSVRPEVSLVEIPVRSNAVSVFMEKNFRDGRAYSAQSISTFRRLMVARRADGHTDMFVVTVLSGAVKRGQKIDENIRNFRYLGGSGFNGRVFCSTLDGRFVEAWQYVDGERSRLAVTTRRHLQEQGDDLSSGEYQSLSLLNGITTRAGTYWDNETGGSGSGYCQFHPQYAASACPYCLDEVIVRECQWCHRTLSEGENCYCRCSWCGYSPCRCCFYCHSYPCRCSSICSICGSGVCSKCTWCGSHYCYGSCRNPGGGTGGGGGDHETNPEQPCSDAKCSNCGKCINPSKPNCERCTGHCNHTICGGCHLAINYENLPMTRGSSDNCNINHEWCSCLWWTKDHNTLTKLGLKNKLTASQFEAVHEGQVIVDGKQKVPDSPLHAMRMPDQTVAEALIVMKNHFCDNVISFVVENNFSDLGQAIHPIQDAYSPAHNFNQWTGANLLPHVFETILTYTPQANAAAKATGRIYDEIMASARPITRTRVEAIFDAWLWRFQNNLEN